MWTSFVNSPSRSIRGFFSRLTRHADALVPSALVEAGPLVEARAGVALVDADLAPRPREAARAVAAVVAGRVHAHAVVLARRPCTQYGYPLDRRSICDTCGT